MKATGTKINANTPTTFVVISLNLRSMAAFAVLAVGFAALPSSIMSATALLWRRRRRIVMIWRMTMIATEGMEMAGSRTFLRVDCWSAASLTKPLVMDTV